MVLGRKISELGRRMNYVVLPLAKDALAITIAFAYILTQEGYTPPARQVYQSSARQNEVIRFGNIVSVDGYLVASGLALPQKSEEPKKRKRFQLLSSSKVPLFDSAGLQMGHQSKGDVLEIEEIFRQKNGEYGKTEEGFFVPLREGERVLAEELLESQRVITPGARNYLIRLIYTEAAAFNPTIPKDDLSQAIRNIISVIDNRVYSGIFATWNIFQVVTQDGQFQGLTDPLASSLLKKGAEYRTDELTLNELVAYHLSAGKQAVIENIATKLELVKKEVDSYLSSPNNSFPLNVVCFKNDDSSTVNWGTSAYKDPPSLGKARHSFYTSEQCLGKSLK